MALLTASVAAYFGSIADAVVSLAFDLASVIVDCISLQGEESIIQDYVTLVLDVAAGGPDVKVFGLPERW